MTILVAPDSFKGTFTAAQVAEIVADGIRAAGVSVLNALLPTAERGRSIACPRR